MYKVLPLLIIIIGILMFKVPAFSQTIDRSNWNDMVTPVEEEYEGLLKVLMDSEEIINEILIRLNLVDLDVEYDGDQISVGWRIMWQSQKSRE
jgi:hypothetical protein